MRCYTKLSCVDLWCFWFCFGTLSTAIRRVWYRTIKLPRCVLSTTRDLGPFSLLVGAAPLLQHQYHNLYCWFRYAVLATAQQRARTEYLLSNELWEHHFIIYALATPKKLNLRPKIN